MFSCYLDYYARKVAICSVAIYCATIREGSLQYSVVLDNLLARVGVACRCNRFLRKINREDRLVSSYYRVMQCRKYFGRRGYYKALWIFICNEQWNIVYGTFRGVFMDKVKNICEKLKSWWNLVLKKLFECPGKRAFLFLLPYSSLFFPARYSWICWERIL